MILDADIDEDDEDMPLLESVSPYARVVTCAEYPQVTCRPWVVGRKDSHYVRFAPLPWPNLSQGWGWEG